jgi:hypothetical protein
MASTRVAFSGRPSSLAIALAASFALPCPALLAAPGDPLSGELQASSDPANSPSGVVDVGRRSDGGLVVVWGGFYGDATPTPRSLRARLFAANGTPQGNEFDVSTDRVSPFSPAVAVAPDGHFAVAWRYGFDDADRGIATRVFSASGAPLSPVRKASTVPVNTDDVDIAMDAVGNFVVSWNEAGSGVFFRRFGPAGVARGTAATEVAQAPAPRHRTLSASVAMEPDGDFVVAWDQRSYGETVSVPGTPYGFELGTQTETVRARRFHANGTVNGDALVVDKRTSTNAPDPLHQGASNGNAQVAVDPNGDFVVVFTGTTTGALGQSVRARRYSPAGEPQGQSIEVGRRTSTSDLSPPDVSMDSSGGFAVAWQSAPSVFVRRFDTAGNALAEKVLVNPTKDAASLNLVGPAIARSANGDVAIVWNGVAQPDPIELQDYVRLFAGP